MTPSSSTGGHSDLRQGWPEPKKEMRHNFKQVHRNTERHGQSERLNNIVDAERRGKRQVLTRSSSMVVVMF